MIHQTDIATTRLTQPRRPSWWKYNIFSKWRGGGWINPKAYKIKFVLYRCFCRHRIKITFKGQHSWLLQIGLGIGLGKIKYSLGMGKGMKNIYIFLLLWMILLGYCCEGNIVPKFQLFNKPVLTVECVIPSPIKGNQTFLGSTGVPFFRIELKP